MDEGFLDNFYNFDQLRGTLVSDQAYQASFNIARGLRRGRGGCIGTWETDFRADLPKITFRCWSSTRCRPSAVRQDRRAPARHDQGHAAGYVSNGPHAIAWTHADQVNGALLSFMT